MKHLANKEMNIPALGFGTYKQVGEKCRKAVSIAIECGYRHLDTAQFYDNESQVGLGIADSTTDRDALFITTKVWRTELKATAVRQSLENSLRDLKTEYVDLLLVHWPNDDIPLEETIEAMATLQLEGKVRHIGGSNFTLRHLKAADKISPIVCNQVEYHPLFGQQMLLNGMAEMNLPLIAYAPLARGKVWEQPTLQEIGRRHGKTPGQVSLRWLIQQENVGGIPKATSREHIEENFAIFDFELSPDDMKSISSIDRGVRMISPEWAPDWGLE